MTATRSPSVPSVAPAAAGSEPRPADPAPLAAPAQTHTHTHAHVPSPAALTPDQLRLLQKAQKDRRKITRAAAVATLSGWTMVTFGSITVLAGIFSLPAFLLGAAMLVAAWVELRGAKGVRRLDADAPRRLGFNQLALGAVMVLYGAWGIYGAVSAPSQYAEHIAAGGEMAAMLQPIDDLHRVAGIALYAGIIVGAGLTTSLTALYYFTRRSHIVAHVTRTPPWVIEAMRAVH